MTIRPVRQDDLEALLAFYWSLSDAVARVFLPPGPVAEDTVRDHLDSVADERTISLVLDRDGVIMGHASLQGLDRGTPMVSIGLRDEIIGYGYGRQLLARLLQIADDRGIPVTALSVVRTNRRAIALYERMGYRRKRLATFREHNDSWHMERVRPDPESENTDPGPM